MALELPDWLTDAFNLIGLPWPGIDEDQLRAWATSVRNFATDITDNSSQVNQTIRELADSSQSSVITAVADQYESHHRLLTELHGPMDDFAQALDYAADAVVAQKWVVIGAATALATEFMATQVGAIFTLGADEAALPEEIISTQQIVKFALKDLEAVVIGRLINWGAQALSDHVSRSIVTLANDAWSVKMETDGLKIAYGNIRRTASQIRGHADEAEDTGNKAHAENTSRDLEDNSGGGGWGEVINALKQGLLDIAGDLFKSLPATIARVLRDIAEILEKFASKLKAADDESAPTPVLNRSAPRDDTYDPSTPISAENGSQALFDRLFPGLRNVNAPRFHLGWRWQENCQSCVVAVDRTLGGKPTEAAPVPDGGFPWPDSVTNTVGGGKPFVPVHGYSDITDELLKAGNGARGVVWGRRFEMKANGEIKERQGHVFNVVNRGGIVYYLDGQTGTFARLENFGSLGFLRTH